MGASGLWFWGVGAAGAAGTSEHCLFEGRPSSVGLWTGQGLPFVVLFPCVLVQGLPVPWPLPSVGCAVGTSFLGTGGLLWWDGSISCEAEGLRGVQDVMAW